MSRLIFLLPLLGFIPRVATKGNSRLFDLALWDPPPPACKPLEYDGQRPAPQRVTVPKFDIHERYGSIISCGGKTILFTRRELIEETARSSREVYHTRVRFQLGSNSTEFGEPFEIPDSELYAHNFAAVCLGGSTIVGFGGQDEDNKHKPHDRGIRRIVSQITEATVTPADLSWRFDKVVLTGNKAATGCVDRRKAFPKCEYDGKLHLVWHNGLLLMYTRANAVSNEFGPAAGRGSKHGIGGRWGQVASSKDNGKTWSRFKLLTLGNADICPDNNLYFFSVHSYFDRDLNASRLVALSPGIVDGLGGVYVATSADGVAFSQPLRILASPVFAYQDRTPDHPVASRPGGGAAAEVIIQMHVQVPQEEHKETYYCAYVVEGGWRSSRAVQLGPVALGHTGVGERSKEIRDARVRASGKQSGDLDSALLAYSTAPKARLGSKDLAGARGSFSGRERGQASFPAVSNLLPPAAAEAPKAEAPIPGPKNTGDNSDAPCQGLPKMERLACQKHKFIPKHQNFDYNARYAEPCQGARPERIACQRQRQAEFEGQQHAGGRVEPPCQDPSADAIECQKERKRQVFKRRGLPPSAALGREATNASGLAYEAPSKNVQHQALPPSPGRGRPRNESQHQSHAQLLHEQTRDKKRAPGLDSEASEARREYGSCKPLVFDGHEAEAARVSVRRLGLLERYGNLVTCGGKTVLFTRRGMGTHNGAEHYATLVRFRLDPAGPGPRPQKKREPPDLGSELGMEFGEPFPLVNGTLYAHNFAAVCLGGSTIVGFGGQDKSDPVGYPRHLGIRRVVASVSGGVASPADLVWRAEPGTGVVVSGDKGKTGCVERRLAFPHCEFDGKHHVVEYAGKLLLYTRANAISNAHGQGPNSFRHGIGGRWAQVASSTDGGITWARFELVEIGGVAISHDTNFYFFTVSPYRDRDLNATRLVALYPGVWKGLGGVFMSTSGDGIHFSEPVRVLHSPVLAFQQRTADHPVGSIDLGSLGPSRGGSRGGDHHLGSQDGGRVVGGAIGRDGGSDLGGAQVLVQHFVHLSPDVRSKQTYFCRYKLKTGWNARNGTSGVPKWTACQGNREEKLACQKKQDLAEWPEGRASWHQHVTTKEYLRATSGEDSSSFLAGLLEGSGSESEFGKAQVRVFLTKTCEVDMAMYEESFFERGYTSLAALKKLDTAALLNLGVRRSHIPIFKEALAKFIGEVTESRDLRYEKSPSGYD